VELVACERHPVGMASLRLGVAFCLCALFAVACGGGDDATESWAGKWVEAGGKPHGHVLEIDGGSNKFLLHGPGPGGHDSHDHWAGTYRQNGAELVLDGTWESTGKAESARAKRTAAGVELGLSSPIQLVKQP